MQSAHSLPCLCPFRSTSRQREIEKEILPLSLSPSLPSLFILLIFFTRVPLPSSHRNKPVGTSLPCLFRHNGRFKFATGVIYARVRIWIWIYFIILAIKVAAGFAFLRIPLFSGKVLAGKRGGATGVTNQIHGSARNTLCYRVVSNIDYRLDVTYICFCFSSFLCLRSIWKKKKKRKGCSIRSIRL